MTGLFSAKRPDGRAEWRVVFDCVKDAQPGDEIEHGTLLAELDTDDMQHLYRAVRRAAQELRKTRGRSLENIPGKGYRVLYANEHENQAESYSLQARRRQSLAVEVLDSTRLEELEPIERQHLISVQAGMRLMLTVLAQHAERLSKHDSLLQQLQQRVEVLESDDEQ